MRKIMYIFLGILFFISGCSLFSNKDDFQFIILKQGPGDDIGWDNVKSIIDQATPSDYWYVINLKDLECVIWDSHTIQLTKESSKKLLDFAHSEDRVSEFADIAADLNERAKTNNPAVMMRLYSRIFLIKTRGRFLTGGIFVDYLAQRSYRYPVSRTWQKNDQVFISLLPVHIPFTHVDPVDESGTFLIKEGAMDNFFRDLIRSIAINQVAVKNRKILYDPELKQILIKAKKLK